MLKKALLIAIIFVSFESFILDQAFSQKIIGIGMLSKGTMSRTRVGGSDFQLGDMLQVTALQPDKNKGMYVSIHMQYKPEGNDWQPVPVPRTPLGMAYLSKLGGIRDYVRFERTETGTLRRICLFVPYEAVSLPRGVVYERRYVIRLWDHKNNEISAKAIQPDKIKSQRQNGNLLVLSSVAVHTCARQYYLGDDGKLNAKIIEPIPMPDEAEREVFTEGEIVFFDTETGTETCPIKN